MLAVHGDEVAPELLHGSRHELSAADEGLLVGECNADALLRRPQRVREPREAARRDEGDVRAVKGVQELLAL